MIEMFINSKKYIIFWFTFTIFIIPSFGQCEKLIGKKFWLKQTIYNIDQEQTTKVCSDWVTYTDKCIEREDIETNSNQYIYPQERILRHQWVEIIAASRENKWVRVVCENSKGEKATLYLRHYFFSGFQKSFNLIFSRIEPKSVNILQNSNEYMSELDLINTQGYPLAKCKIGKTTLFYYNLALVGSSLGANDRWYIIKNGLVIDSYYIE
jgi:hypothetical protein